MKFGSMPCVSGLLASETYIHRLLYASGPGEILIGILLPCNQSIKSKIRSKIKMGMVRLTTCHSDLPKTRAPSDGHDERRASTTIREHVANRERLSGSVKGIRVRAEIKCALKC